MMEGIDVIGIIFRVLEEKLNICIVIKYSCIEYLFILFKF